MFYCLKFQTSNLIKLTTLTLLLVVCYKNVSYSKENISPQNNSKLDKTQETIKTTFEVYDPWIGFNRKIFSFNQIITDKFFLPISNWYIEKAPLAVKYMLYNFAKNYKSTPMDIAYSVLDFDIEGIIVSVWRFVINSTIGGFGIDDVAGQLGLKSYDKTLGNILSLYRIPLGPYFVVPFLGPNNIRDFSGFVIQTLLTSVWFMNLFVNNAEYMRSYLIISPFQGYSFELNRLPWVSFSHSMIRATNVILLYGMIAKNIPNSEEDKYIVYRTGYYHMLNKKFEEYKEKRFNGVTTRENICDYDAMVELPDDCDSEGNSDPKEYVFELTKATQY